jgi:hypothetical protein
MKHEDNNIIHFSFRLMESVEVRLKGNLECRNGIYLIKDIRAAHKEAGSLLPPVKLKKVEEVWVHSDSLKPSNLSVAIGKALDEDGRDFEANGSDPEANGWDPEANGSDPEANGSGDSSNG